MGIDVGISLSSSVQGDDPLAVAAMVVERARTAYAAGLSSLTVGDHHAQPHWYQQNTPTLGRLLAEWPDRRAGCLFLLPLWSPLLVAEHVGTLAGHLDAPFIVQTGIGRGAHQFAAFGADLGTRGRVTDESIRTIQALLAGDTVGSPAFDMAPASVALRPSRGVEWWIGGHATAGLRRAAEFGTAWYAGPNLRTEESAPYLDEYRTQCERFGTSPSAIIRRDVLVLADGAAARRAATERVEAGYRGMSVDQLLVGSVDNAVAHLDGLAEAGFGEVIIRCVSADQAQALETIELMGEAQRQLRG
ncbi:MAG: LLM class flavin-dependent oxidoreductase [Actinomycetota bacterium]